jgi:hypothetical protein
VSLVHPTVEETGALPNMLVFAVIALYLTKRLREDGVEVELLDEGPTAPHPDLPEDVLEVVLHRVLGDVESQGDLLGGGAANDQLDHFLLAGAQPVAARG